MNNDLEKIKNASARLSGPSSVQTDYYDPNLAYRSQMYASQALADVTSGISGLNDMDAVKALSGGEDAFKSLAVVGAVIGIVTMFVSAEGSSTEL